MRALSRPRPHRPARHVPAQRDVTPDPPYNWEDGSEATQARSPVVNGYRDIAAQLSDQIESGQLRPGDALPSEAALMAEHGVARRTARRALAVLEESGTVVARRGVGRFVVGGPEQPATPKPVAARLSKAQELADDLRQQIESGELRPGADLPSENDLATARGLGRGTVRRAFAELEAHGLIENRPGLARRVAQ